MMKYFVEAVFFVFLAAALVNATVKDNKLEDPQNVKDFSDAGELHVDDTTEVAAGEYEGKQGDGEREKRSVKR